MLKWIAVSGLATLAIVATSAPLAAQARSAVSPTELDSAVRATVDTNQQSVQRFLRDPRVADVAARMGIRTADLAGVVGTLDAATLGQVADRTRAAERDLAGGDSIVISTTVVIIALLVLILLTR